MKLAGNYSFDAPLPVVWQALFDPEVLAKTLPGCEKLEREGDTFKGEMNVKMGPVQGKFQGKVDVSRVTPLESYDMVIDGRGPAGFVKATAQLALRGEGEATHLDYQSDIQVGGRIASVGQRLLEASSRAIAKQSLEGLHEQIRALAARLQTSDAAAAAASEPPPSSGTEAPAAAGAPAVAASGALRTEAAAASQGASPAAFAMGVAKEVTKELLPMRTVVVVVAILILLGVLYALVGA